MTSEAKDESQPILIIDLTDEKYDVGVEIWPNYEDTSPNEVYGETPTSKENILDLSTSKSSNPYSSDLNSSVGSDVPSTSSQLFEFANQLTAEANQINVSRKAVSGPPDEIYFSKVFSQYSYLLEEYPEYSYLSDIFEEYCNLNKIFGELETPICFQSMVPYYGILYSNDFALYRRSKLSSPEQIMPFDNDTFGFDSEEYSHWKYIQELEFKKEMDKISPGSTKKRPLTEEPTSSSSWKFEFKNRSNSSNSLLKTEEKEDDDDSISLKPWKSSAARLKRENLDLNNYALKDEYSFKQLEIIQTAPKILKYYSSLFHSNNTNFLTSLNRERRLLQNDLPPGIYVKMFEDRMDLLSALIEGPTDTPYEGCLFNFDIQLSTDHPSKPPHVHYWAFCGTKLNPNLNINGQVFSSLLGTCHGNEQESWSDVSSIYQLLISIQGFILVKEPYYNELWVDDSQRNHITQEQSKCYNFQALNLVIDSIIKQIHHPPLIFKDQVISFYRKTGLMSLERFEKELELFEEEQPASEKLEVQYPFSSLEIAFKKLRRHTWPLGKKDLELKINMFYHVFVKFINNN